MVCNPIYDSAAALIIFNTYYVSLRIGLFYLCRDQLTL